MVVGNHQSLLDILILLAYLPIDLRFIAKTELYSIPLLGWFIRTAGHIRVDRARVGSGFTSLKKAVEYLTNNISVVIFPEGTRSHDGTLGRFKGGAIFATIESAAPIQPVAISGSYNILPRGHIYFRPTTVKLTIGKPIYNNKDDNQEQKLEEIRKTIAAML